MTMTKKARQQIIETHLEVHANEKSASRVPMRLGGEEINLPLIRLPLDSVVLNPSSHRIKAQLESHPDAELVRSDPFSDQAQTLITEVIKSLEGYDELKQNLNEDDQRDHGIITHLGLLVNANRRAVALRDLGQDYIRVAVLPPTVLPREIMQLELSLQRQVEFREDYTYTNNLLFVDELLTEWGRTREQAALMLGWSASKQPSEINKGVKAVDQATRVLGLIRRTQQMAPGRIPLIFFDEKISHLERTDSDYQGLRDSNPVAAEQVLQGLLMSTLVGARYRDLRLYDENFMEEYLLQRFEDSDTLRHLIPYLTTNGADAADSTQPEGLDILDSASGDVPDDGVDPTRLFQLIAENWTQSEEATVSVTGDDEPVTLRILEIHEELASGIHQAAEEAAIDQRYDKGLDAPFEHMRLAAQHIRRAGETFDRVFNVQDFKIGNFQYRIRKHLQSVEDLRDRAADSRG